MATRLLIIEDDRKAALLLARGLREEGFEVTLAHSAEAGAKLVHEGDYELIVLDWMLPDRDGIVLCRELRARGLRTPVLLLTARDGLSDRVAGLNSGADDYLTKPFAFAELLARLQALMRRAGFSATPLLVCADLAVDPISRSVTRGREPIDLTPKEYALLELLVRDAGRVVSRVRIAERIWNADLIAIDNLIDVHISNLRRKLDAPGLAPLIHTARGRGFRLGADGA